MKKLLLFISLLFPLFGLSQSTVTAGIDAVNTSQLGGQSAAFYTNNILTAKVTLSSAQLLAINTTPITIISAGGSGTIIELLGMNAKLTYNSIAYTLAGGDLGLYETNAAGTFIANWNILFDDFLSITTTERRAGLIYGGVVTKLTENTPLVVTVDTGDPISGNSSVDIYVAYRIITL